MPHALPATKLDSATPSEIAINAQPRVPEADPTLGIPVATSWQGKPRPNNRLVTIGDSLTHGFQSGAVFNTDLSYPAIIAYELGWYRSFRFPTYNGAGGIPLNIELLLRDLAQRYGQHVDLWEVPLALFRLRQSMDEIEDYWERGPGSASPIGGRLNHNLGVYGWDLGDTLVKTADSCRTAIGTPKDDPVIQIVQNNGERAALRVLPCTPDTARQMTVFDAAEQLGKDFGDGDPEHGIETLVIFLGANNALPTVTQLDVAWSGDGYDDPAHKNRFTVWRPSHFAAELARIADRVRPIRARHIIWCTVPHVTVAPIARGIGAKIEPGSRYFPYYTRPWISDRTFNPKRDPYITSQQARAVDSAIDQYNDVITDMVRAERRAGRDWYVVDIAGMLDRLAARRYTEDLLARPDWWTPYPLPPELQALRPLPDSRFLTSDGNTRATGGLFSLDGVHPTTIGYGLIAQEIINVMQLAGVTFLHPDGRTPRTGPITVDFARLLQRDTLVNRPPGNLTAGLDIIGWADQAGDVLRRVLPFRIF
ncbi:hypothetical protein [Frankia sp. QA3]|uniref:hypothetical protein n=1 Tax=Frankia sp. QA3 TaxID=710111 RepID=UPI000269BEE2|nr:hypothetical protein FraQA3DRAFT_1948 [Frankia sp. QA3]